MKEIKFRGKTQEGNWVHGDLTTFQYPDNVKPVLCWIWVQSEDFKTISKVQVDHNTIGQFTGFLMGDIEVYEGDVIKCSQGSDDVVEENSGRYWCRHRDISLHDLFMNGLAVEVIGNIHDK